VGSNFHLEEFKVLLNLIWNKRESFLKIYFALSMIHNGKECHS
jgi:hypothetical protein